MVGGHLNMSDQECDRLILFERLKNREIKQKEVAQLLDLSSRQVRRLMNNYKKEGPKALVSKKRGRLGNHRLPLELKSRALSLIIKKYPDFSPTLAHEKLLYEDKLNISLSVIRKIMIQHHLWIPKQHKPKMIHQLRMRRECFGALLIIDGSHHRWFDHDNELYVLLVFIDDATGRLMQLRMARSEDMWGYFEAFKTYLKKYGRPLEVYCDRHAVFTPRKHVSDSIDGRTQFQRAMSHLGIKITYARSPQAKGRVERANRTLQDRFVKELKLRGIGTIEAANAFAETYIVDYNKKFAISPKSSVDAHRNISESVDLEYIFSFHSKRRVDKNCIFQYCSKHYMLIPEGKNHLKRIGKDVTVTENQVGGVRVFLEGKEIDYRVYEEEPCLFTMQNNKQQKAWLRKKDKKQARTENHPWKSHVSQPVCL